MTQTARSFSKKAWLALAVGEDRQHAGNAGYADQPSTSYRWDNTVPNHASVAPGDALVVWDKHVLVGVSVIDGIAVESGEKVRYSCPSCHRSNIKRRKSKSPLYRCHGCNYEFDVAREHSETVTTYTSDHGAHWIDLPGVLTGAELRQLCVSPKSQLSIRPLTFGNFVKAVEEKETTPTLSLLSDQHDLHGDSMIGGHKRVTARARIGQAAFRAKLLQIQGPVCAISGPCPECLLDAAHLYSYAASGEHHSDGGWMLRRDIHRLFDLGLIAVNPSSGKIDLVPEISAHPDYARLTGQTAHPPIKPDGLKWLKTHWAQYRD